MRASALPEGPTRVIGTDVTAGQSMPFIMAEASQDVPGTG
jgi:hypothetical protein